MQDKRQRTQTATQEVLPKHQEALLGWVEMEPRHSLPRGCGGSSWGISRSHLDVGLGPLLRVALLGQGSEQKDPEVPASLLWLCDSP